MVEVNDLFQDGVELVLNFLIGNSEDAVTESLKVSVSIEVMSDLHLLFMDRTVELNDEP